eukprot:1137947-Pelagomonas_calceolata.AAC.14
MPLQWADDQTLSKWKQVNDIYMPQKGKHHCVCKNNTKEAMAIECCSAPAAWMHQSKSEK